MSVNSGRLYARLLGGAAILALSAGAAWADPANFNIAPQPLSMAVNAFSEQSGRAVLLKPELADKLNSPGVSGSLEPQIALAEMLQGTGLTYRQSGDTFLIERADAPQSGSAAGDGADGTVAALIVTAQKREENVQDVPIAISAFTEKSLQEQKIEGGFDLLKAIPNVTFSKNNFSSYNFSIRGIGTKAISVTTDPGVAVEFNNTALIRNRLFEQEYFDVERVEVLRGPQGTLHGRNATAGVINVISAKPTDHFEGSVKAEVGNYQSRRASGFVNVPLIGDKLAVRFAGSFTDRDGYDYNERTQHPINGRNLWSGRLSIGFKPFERLHSVFVWEHFSEDDDRSRTGKQLCHHDAGPTEIGGEELGDPTTDTGALYRRASFSQGCKAGSLYNDDAFGTPNGLSEPFILVGADNGNGGADLGNTQQSGGGQEVYALAQRDPYGGMMQSRNLRVIDSIRDPIYRAKADIFELNFDVDITPSLTVTSQTAYNRDELYSFQDYNRFNTVPIFNDSSGLWGGALNRADLNEPSPFRNMLKGGIFCDPQIGCSDSIAGFDISQAKSRQFSQELRVQSSFGGRINFAAGANYTRYQTLEDYYVFYNIITLLAESPAGFTTFNGTGDITTCLPSAGFFNGRPSGFHDYDAAPVPLGDPSAAGCIYIDPNPIDKINGEGHNYFRSKNPYKLSSTAAFGEVYWQASEDLKVTAGLRYTDDRKTFTPVPSQILLSSALFLEGTVDRGYPALPDIKQHWGEFTGRLGVDWRPKLAATDQTLIYLFYSRGYKGGGANPPGIGFDKGPCLINSSVNGPCLQPLSYPPLFKPEFVNAFELGSKNTLLGGSLVLNGDVFFYDYKDYQVSQIKERTAVNENFSAKVWGAELESIWSPARNTRFNLAFGYQGTRIADGAKSIDLMNRTQGHAGYVVVKPFVQMASNCVASESYALEQMNSGGPATICPGLGGAGLDAPDVDLPNHGAGFFAELGGNELPNAPHWTVSLGGQHSFDFLDNWRATLRGDAYWQAQSWARVYNDNPYDKLHGWYNANLSLWLENDDGLKIELYAKNILDKTPITDAFLNSDDTALTTNVFVLDPRLIGLSIKKGF